MRHMLRAVAASAALVLPAAAPAQTLEVAVNQAPVGLDPHIATAFGTFQVISGTIYEGLTALDANLRVVPGLAESWTIAPDGKTYTFKLRGGVTFHDGARMDSADVAATLRRVMSQQIGSPLASRFAAIDAINAPDATTVELKLKEPAAPLLVSLATLAIVPKGMEADKEALQKQPVGTGPFRFQEWTPNSHVLLQKHAGYWAQGLPRLAGVKFNLVPESATQQAGIAGGTYAMLANIDAATALQLAGKPGIGVAETLELAYTLIGMNVSKPPFNDERVREALNYALDRREIVTAAQFGKGVPGGPLSPALKDWAVDVKDFPCYAPSAAKARELLAAAGAGQPTIAINVLPRQDIRDVAQVVQAQLNRAGFKAELKNQELGQFIQDWRNSNFDAFASTNAGSPDPDDYFFRTFRTGGSTNVFKYANPELDKLLDTARATLDSGQRRGMYAEVQKILACKGPIAHLTYGQLFTATRANVQGYQIMPNRSLSYLRETSLSQ